MLFRILQRRQKPTNAAFHHLRSSLRFYMPLAVEIKVLGSLYRAGSVKREKRCENISVSRSPYLVMLPLSWSWTGLVEAKTCLLFRACGKEVPSQASLALSEVRC